MGTDRSRAAGGVVNGRARAALCGSRLDTAIIALACVVALLLAAYVVVRSNDGIPATLTLVDVFTFAIVSTFAIAFAVFGLVAVVQPFRLSREIKRIDALPFPFDQTRYFELLGTEHSSVKILFDTHFSTPIPPKYKPQMQQAVIALADKAKLEDVRWVDDRTMRFSSPFIDTSYSAASGQFTNRWKSNERVHRWFKEHAFPIFCAVNVFVPIAKIDFTL